MATVSNLTDAKSPMRRRTRTAAAAVAVAAVSLVGCSAASDNSDASAHASDVSDPGFGHVHGLGVNPGESAVYVATHSGVWRVPTTSTATDGALMASGPAKRIAGRLQDTMGFVIAGRDRFYGSGHPDFNEQPDLRPPLLGFITSTDRAQTWTTVALRGRADFHDIEVADEGRHILGYNSTNGQIMVSVDSGRSWTNGAVAELRDLAMNPAKPDVVLATMRQGLARSADSGRTFTVLRRAPALLLVAWAPATARAASTVWGVDASGAVWSTTAPDTGSAWKRQGQLHGTPEALAAFSTPTGTRLLAADESGVVTSSDGGRTWTLFLAYPDAGADH
jgi:hypothetical protein